MSEQFDFNIPYAISVVKQKEAKTVGLQFPEGFKRKAAVIATELERETGCKIIISGNPCFGACDIDETLVHHVDMLLHFGHAPLESIDKVEFIEVRSNVDVMPVLKIAVPMLTKERIGVLTTVQHVHKVDEVCKYLISKGKVPVTCEVNDVSPVSETHVDDLRIRYPGQLLGCDFSAARIPCDEYLYIGGGEFHPLGVAIATGRRVLVADPMTSRAWFIDTDRIMRQRFAAITRAQDAACFAIIVSTKRGQFRPEVAEEMVKLARDSGRDAYIISMDLITPEQLLAFKADAFVSTACPRVAVDDNLRYTKPMLTPIEFEILVGKRQWDEFVFDEITQ